MTMARYLRMKNTHPTMIKLFKLCELADKLGISFSFHGHVTIVKDEDHEDLPLIRLEDIDNREAIMDWPPGTEFCAIYENPAYIAEQKRLKEEQLAEAAKLAQIAKEQKERKKKENEKREVKEKEKRQQEKERKERDLLVKLKAKYEK